MDIHMPVACQEVRSLHQDSILTATQKGLNIQELSDPLLFPS